MVGYNPLVSLPARFHDIEQLFAHPDLYERSHGAVRLKIRDGRIDLRSFDCAGYASVAMPDFTAMTAIEHRR